MMHAPGLSPNGRWRMTAGRLAIGIVGGGLIAQVEHIPNLILLRDMFELKGVSDPSATVRDGLARRFDVTTVPDADALLGLGLDALLIAAPDPWHAALAERAMDAGLHVFCEKPLCYGLAEMDALAIAQRRSGVILQVGYMKRFDPSYEAALDLVRDKASRLRLVCVEVTDPDAWPFVAHQPLVAGTDVPSDLIEETNGRRRSQITQALGFTPTEPVFRGFAGAYCSALVHDVNAVHGLLDAVGVASGQVLGASLFANGAGGQAAIDLRGGQALWTLAYAELPKVAAYSERIAFYFEDEIVELVFPAPYLNNHPTRLVHTRSRGALLDTASIRPSYEEGFVRELVAFWASIVKQAPAKNTVMDARRDQALLIDMARKVQSTAACK